MDAKKFPKTVEDMFKPVKSGGDDILSTIKAFKANQDKAKRLSKRKKDVTIHREE